MIGALALTCLACENDTDTTDSSSSVTDARPAADTVTQPQTDTGTAPQDAAKPVKTPMVQMGGSDDEGKGFIDWSSEKEAPPLIHGIQGGEHVFFSVRVKNVDPKKMNLKLHMTMADTGEIVFPGPLSKYKQTLKKETVDGNWTGWYFKNGFIGFVHCPCLVAGQKLKFELVVTTQDGKTTMKDSHIIVPGSKKVAPHWDGDCNDDEHDQCKT